MCKTCEKIGTTCTMCQAEAEREKKPAHRGTVRIKEEREENAHPVFQEQGS